MKNPPPFLKTVPVQESNGTTVHYALCQNLESLLYLANLGTICQNPWLSRIPHLAKQGDLFKNVLKVRNSLAGPLKKLEFLIHNPRP